MALTDQEKRFIKSSVSPAKTVINELFAKGGNIVATSQQIGTDKYGKPELVYEHAGGIHEIALQVCRYVGEDMARTLGEQSFERHRVTPDWVTLDRIQPIT